MLSKLTPRLISLILFAALAMLALYLAAPEQMTVVLYKAAVVTFAAVLGYWIDRAIFPYARPDSYLVDDWRRTKSLLSEYGEPGAVDHPVIGGYQQVYSATQIRRALIIVAVVIGVGLGL